MKGEPRVCAEPACYNVFTPKPQAPHQLYCSVRCRNEVRHTRMYPPLDPSLMYPAEAARVLGITADTVAALANRGKIKFKRARGNWHLYDREDVQRLARRLRAER